MKKLKPKNSYDPNLPSTLIYLWRVFFFIFASSFLSLCLINNGWEEINAENIQIKGNNYIHKKRIVRHLGIKLPVPLLEINPKQVEESLLKKLPIKVVRSSRRIYPPGIYLEIQEREPVAKATRIGPQGIEQGLIDKDAHWIELGDPLQSRYKINDLSLSIDGWMKSHQKWIAYIYQNQDKLRNPLQKIILSPNGEISLKTKDFELIELGYNPSILREQVSTIVYLTKNLPKRFTDDLQTTIDLKDPSRPKLLFK
ncbi:MULTISPECIES: cell division protein FtsQ/DivIB [Prochlorococcus]|uniref:cell division protein FtsQ/DivIB n=1 Tax=Prochlorococcus TaxID=1218 RepID=UPI00068EEF2A|nr:MULTISPECIES: FtsQ-type POTRA domain-containing protein [Prochlorococcus]